MQLKAGEHLKPSLQSPDSLISTPQKLKSHISWYEMKKKKWKANVTAMKTMFYANQ